MIDRHRYELCIAGLPEAVASAPRTDKHSALLVTLRSLPSLGRLRLAKADAGATLIRRQVLAPNGSIVAHDHRVWLREECDHDGNLMATVRRLRALGYWLTESECTTLFLVQDLGGAQEHFIQLRVSAEDEFLDRRLFSEDDEPWYRPPSDLRDVVMLAEDGVRLASDRRRRIGPDRYVLEQAIDVERFIAEATAVETTRRTLARERTIAVVEVFDGGRPAVNRQATIGELDPEGGRYPWKGRRLFDDWSASSAGRSGARLCDHWVLHMSDGTWGDGVREMMAIPAWTYPRKIAKIEKMPSSIEALYAKLLSIDQRTGVPFGWYFWMLHGNRIRDWAGREIIDGAEGGRIVLPEHDYQVLKRWNDRPYGF